MKRIFKKIINKIFKDDFTDNVVAIHLLWLPTFVLLNLFPYDSIITFIMGVYCLLVIFSSCLFINEYEDMKRELNKLQLIEQMFESESIDLEELSKLVKGTK